MARQEARPDRPLRPQRVREDDAPAHAGGAAGAGLRLHPDGLGHDHRLPAAGRHRPPRAHRLRGGRPRLPGAALPQGGAAPDRGRARPRHRGRRGARQAPRALRGSDRALQAPRGLGDRRPGGRRPEGPRLLSRRPAEKDGGVLGRLADAHRPGQAPPRPPQPPADGRAHEPPRPAGAELARGVPRRLPGVGRARLARPLLPRRHRQADHRGRAQDPHRLPRQLLALRHRARRADGAAARGAPPAERGGREGRGLHQPLPLHGHEGPAGPEPDQAARQGGADRAAARAEEDPLQVPGGPAPRPGGPRAQGRAQGVRTRTSSSATWT